jgi:hypothetical protein
VLGKILGKNRVLVIYIQNNHAVKLRFAKDLDPALVTKSPVPIVLFKNTMFCDILYCSKLLIPQAGVTLMALTKIDRFSDFISLIGKKFTQDQDKSLLFVDIDGILTVLREFYIENALTIQIAAFLKECFIKSCAGVNTAVYKLTELLAEEISKPVAEDMKKRIQKEVTKQNQERTQKGLPPLNGEEVNQLSLDIICKQLAFGIAMETSPACELELPILPGMPSERQTLARDLLDLLKSKPKMHLFFLTSRPVGAAQNIKHILSDLCRASHLEESALFEFIKERNGDLRLDTRRAFEHEIHVVADGICIASGRNRKDKVIEAFFEQMGAVVSQTGFIDDKESYAAEVVGLAAKAEQLVVAQQKILSAKEVSELVATNNALNRTICFSMRNAVQNYPIHQLPESRGLSSAANLALSGFMLLGLMTMPEAHPLAGQAAMQSGQDQITTMLTRRIPQIVEQNSHVTDMDANPLSLKV